MNDTMQTRRNAQGCPSSPAGGRVRPGPRRRGEPLGKIFARNLRQARMRAGVKSYAAAALLGVSKSTWSQWESCKRLPGIAMLEAIAGCLGIQPCELLRRKGAGCDAESEVHAM